MENRRQSDGFEQCPRYDKHELSEEQIISIARKACELARDDFKKEVGDTVISKFLWIVGAITLAIVYKLNKMGVFH